MQQQRVKVSDIHIAHDRKRKHIDVKTVEALAASIREIGLQSPISIYFANDYEIDGELLDNVPILAAGAHRREALLLIGDKYDYIDCVVFEDRDTARLWELSENLHRSDLTDLERKEHTTEWITLTVKRREEINASQLVTHKKRGQQPDGINAASRELGINRMDAHRAMKVASLPEEAKQIARDTGLDNNQSAMLTAAKEPTPEAQTAKMQELADLKADKSKPRDEDRKVKQREQFWKMWSKLDDDVRQSIVAFIISSEKST